MYSAVLYPLYTQLHTFCIVEVEMRKARIIHMHPNWLFSCVMSTWNPTFQFQWRVYAKGKQIKKVRIWVIFLQIPSIPFVWVACVEGISP